MNETLQAKIENIAVRYADLVDMRIQTATNSELPDPTAMTEINEEIRMLHHAIAALERIVRLNRNDETNCAYPRCSNQSI